MSLRCGCHESEYRITQTTLQRALDGIHRHSLAYHFTMAARQRTRALPGKRQRTEKHEDDIIRERAQVNERMIDMLDEITKSEYIPIELSYIKSVSMESMYASPYEDGKNKRSVQRDARYDSEAERLGGMEKLRAKMNQLRARYDRPPSMLKSLEQTPGAQEGRAFDVTLSSQSLLDREQRSSIEELTAYLIWCDLNTSVHQAEYATVIDAQSACLDYVSYKMTKNRADPHTPLLSHFCTYLDREHGVAITVALGRPESSAQWSIQHLHYLPAHWIPTFPSEMRTGA